MTTETLRQTYPPRLRWARVMALGTALGFTDWRMRRIIESGAVKKIVYPGTVLAYYDRDEILSVLAGEDPGEGNRRGTKA